MVGPAKLSFYFIFLNMSPPPLMDEENANSILSMGGTAGYYSAHVVKKSTMTPRWVFACPTPLLPGSLTIQDFFFLEMALLGNASPRAVW